VQEICSKWATTRTVPPSGGSLEIGNVNLYQRTHPLVQVPPSGGSLEIGNRPWPKITTASSGSSPFGGIPRNWKPFARRFAR